MAQYIKESSNPSDFIDIFIRACLRWRGSGLDIGIDTLIEVGGQTLTYAEEYYIRDCTRWSLSVPFPRHYTNDDVWYILLRSLGMSSLSLNQILPLCIVCLVRGVPNVRDSAILALYDKEDDDSIAVIKEHLKNEKSQMVRETILEILEEYNAS